MGEIEDQAYELVDSLIKKDIINSKESEYYRTYEQIFKAGLEAGKTCPPEGCSIQQIEESCIKALNELGLTGSEYFYNGKLFNIFKAGVENSK